MILTQIYIQGDSSDDETVPTRSAIRNKGAETANSQELDVGHLMDAEEASKKFRKAEKKRGIHILL